MIRLLPKNPTFRCSFTRIGSTLCFGLALSLLSTKVQAQNVSTYGFSQSQQAYAELADPTAIAIPTAQTSTGSVDDQVYALPEGTIPFPFSFRGIAYTGLNVMANGSITFGSTASNTSTPISSANAYEGVIAAMSSDIHAFYNLNGITGSLSYAVVGSAPNREFVVQWAHFKPYSSFAVTTSYFDLNFQIRLKEDNTISVVYNSAVTGTPTSASPQVGLRGATNADFNNRKASGTASSNWTTTVSGTSSSDSVTNNSTSIATNGLKFTWTPPSACVAPSAQPSNLVLTSTGIVINGSFTAADPAADSYLVLRTPVGTTPNVPVNGTNYTLGANQSLNAYVAHNGSATTFENAYNQGIRGNNTYVYTVYAVNAACSGGPLYLTASPVSGNVTNCLQGVSTLMSTTTHTSLTLNWAATENGTVNPYNTIVEVATNNTFTAMVEGSPFTLDPATNTLTATGLQSGTQYYYRVKNVSANCETTYTSGNATTVYVTAAPWVEPFAGTTAPAGWSASGWLINTVPGAPGNTGANIYKNLYSWSDTGTFSTITVGPLDADTYELSFDYRQGAYGTPYAPLATWGNFAVQVSTDFGATWTTLGTVTDEAGTGAYIHKTFPLSGYNGQYVKVRINATRTSGDFWLSFDNFSIDSQLAVADPVKHGVSLYPNPTNGIFSIHASDDIKTVNVYNSIGQLVLSQNSATVDLSAQPSGIYVVSVAFGDHTQTIQKVVRK